ncbi:hypothetical protein KM043_016568 [Ampulex compressa]|nr:hypothetical protein KM043_016568 [Ampulex compressa]
MTRCQESEAVRSDGWYERQDVGMAGCQDSSQLRVTYITNDCGPAKQRRNEEESRARADASRSVGGPLLRASHRLSSRRYADPAARLSYFNASVIGSPPATGILKATPPEMKMARLSHRPVLNPNESLNCNDRYSDTPGIYLAPHIRCPVD